MLATTTRQTVRRYAAATWRPGAVLIFTAAIATALPSTRYIAYSGAPDGAQASIAAVTFSLLIAAAASLVRLACNVWRAVRQPYRDADAYERLTEARDAAQQEDRQLLEIHRTQWTTDAGQRAWVIDSASGAIIDYWFPGQAFPTGSFVLIRRSNIAGEVISWLPPDHVAAATRHAELSRHRLTDLLARQRRRRAREERVAARAVVEAAERLLKL